ncbi:thiamine kinase-like enzyme [Naumannella cuiyingiana]|uniref:Thiamine kinase-like enzyme n=2 Tax=Naumannella cuiyingiana TaxID=1347891 RepID=A0A7Z0D916_9ACTN|nr:thiamine kinase-like enzyme [Naumannella cuiyingiana]
MRPDAKPMGTARTSAERAAEKVLAGVEQWRGRELSYAPVSGGLQNSNWRVDIAGDDRAYFVKIPGAGSDAFIDRGAANEASRRAGEIGIGPELVLFDAEQGVEVIEFLEGYRACTNGDLKRPEISHEIVALYRRLNAAEPLTLTKTVLDMIDEHRDQAAELGVTLPPSWAAIAQGYTAARAALTASGLDLVPCHNDPMPGNFLISPGGPMRMVDFEFASNNERAYELAVMTTEMFYDEDLVAELVEDFYGAASYSLLSRVHVCGALADVKWGLWGVVNSRLNAGAGGWSFDYHKYGLWKLARARMRMADPRWGLWLARL